MLYIIVGFIISSLISLFIFQRIVLHVMNTPPSNHPKAYLSKPKGDKKVIINIGDSITHGVVSHNYSKIIEAAMSPKGYETINAGINADLAYTVMQRIDDIVACKPAIATILIGTNDVISSMGEARLKHYWAFGRLPKGQRTSLEFYKENLAMIVEKLKTVPGIKIYLFSVPVLGEDLVSEANQKTMAYGAAAKELAESEGLHYLPLNESMREYLAQSPTVNGLEFGDERIPGIVAVVKHDYFRQSWDAIAKSNSLQLTTETIHLNGVGANMVADLALDAFSSVVK